MPGRTRGKFIVLDGNEGSGKTTLIKVAREKYGDNLLLTREIGGTPFAEEIRKQMFSSEGGKQADANTQFNLAWAARADHLKNVIKPALDQGVNVLSDRFDSSTFAYQLYGQEARELEELFWIERKVVIGNYLPDLYILLDVIPENGVKRKGMQTDHVFDNYDNQPFDFYDRVREGYTDFLEKAPHKIIDANQSLEKVQAEFLEILSDIIGS